MRTLVLALITLLATPLASATIVFQDDFSDGVADGWSFIGQNAGQWVVENGEFRSAASQTAYAGRNGFATIDGIADLQHFRLEADVRVIGSVPNRGSDFGHVGFGWGIQSTSAFNNSYLRTHSNHVTNWSRPSPVEHFLTLPFNAVNDAVYAMALEVDYVNEVMEISLAGFARTFSGTAFRQINRQTSGAIGLTTWGERVGYDNVVLRDLDAVVPAPAPLLLLGLAGFAAALRRRSPR